MCYVPHTHANSYANAPMRNLTLFTDCFFFHGFHLASFDDFAVQTNATRHKEGFLLTSRSFVTIAQAVLATFCGLWPGRWGPHLATKD